MRDNVKCGKCGGPDFERKWNSPCSIAGKKLGRGPGTPGLEWVASGASIFLTTYLHRLGSRASSLPVDTDGLQGPAFPGELRRKRGLFMGHDQTWPRFDFPASPDCHTEEYGHFTDFYLLLPKGFSQLSFLLPWSYTTAVILDLLVNVSSNCVHGVLRAVAHQKIQRSQYTLRNKKHATVLPHVM